ncbi:MAG TPA: helix-turn-helix transcriptional regulator [Thermoanaerobaculia bacterium]|jgi:transcriptional regulator with XRE-family HTH domain
MKLGDVLKKERVNKEVSQEETAERLGISLEDYQQMENGESPAESWGPTLAQIAITLETPTSRLLAESGRFADTKEGQAGSLIKGHRERREKSVKELAEALEMSEEAYLEIEAGKSPIERFGPLLLGFAEVIEQPVFNLFYPCGLPFQELDDYP